MPALRHLGVNAVFLEPGLGGLDTYVRRLVGELVKVSPALRITVFVNRSGEKLLSTEPWSPEVTMVPLRLLGIRGARAVSEIAAVGRVARHYDVELLHSVAMTGPLVAAPPHVVTVGDVIWLHDPTTVGRVTSTMWKIAVPRVARAARRVLTFSRASKADITARLAVPADRIDVVPLGPGTVRVSAFAEPDVRRRWDLGDDPVILCVSAKKSHKNLVRLVRALRIVRERVPAVLVIPGEPTAHEEELREEARAAGVEGALRLPPYLPADELEALYAAAACAVLPSLWEGFGLPVLEAMVRGVPVACSSTSSLPEVGGDAARYFDPESEQEIAAAIVELLTNEAEARRLAARGRERAAEFDWRRTAEETFASYERALAEAPR